MIRYDKAAKTFHLSGKNYSYIMCVGQAEYLQHLYYGAALCDSDAAYLLEKVGKPQDFACADGGGNSNINELWSEYPSFGRGDYHEPCAILERADGSVMSRLRYVSYKIEKGAPALKGLPHTRHGDETLIIVLKDDLSPVEIKLYYIVNQSLDVLVRYAEIINFGTEPVRINRAFSFSLDLPDNKFKLLRLSGNKTAERTPEFSSLGHGVVKLQSLRGASSHQLNPFAALCRNDASETSGECYGIQLIYSGSWAITVEADNTDKIRVQGGINDTAFSWELDGGKTFATPQVALCYSADGLGRMSVEYADFLRNCIINPKFVNSGRPILVNNWEATYFDFNYDKLFAIIDAAAELGIDTFVLDDGWFGHRNWDNSSLGDWFVNTKKLPRGLTPIIERCKEKGLKFGLWFEPEMISEDSDLYRAHPDWALGKRENSYYRERNQLVLDFTRREVVDYVFEAIGKILSENDISYVKWDMNRSISEFYSSALTGKNQGDLAHRYILGVYELAERLTAAFGNIFFEGCSCGGGRFDAGMLYYFPQIWTSDNTDAYDRARIQWGTSFCYPASAMSCHVSACPNHQTQRTVPLATRGVIASIGATGYELDLSKLTDSEKQEIKEQIKSYKEIEKLVIHGDLFRLSNPFEENFFCEALVSKDKSQAYVVGEQLRAEPNGYIKEKYLKLSGLDEEKIYHIKEFNISASGAVLTKFGVPLPHLPDYGSFVLHLSEVKNG